MGPIFINLGTKNIFLKLKDQMGPIVQDMELVLYLKLKVWFPHSTYYRNKKDNKKI